MKNLAGKISILLISIFGFSIFAAGNAFAADSCFWMDPDKDNTWVSTPQENVDKQQCFNLDSCDGGKGESGGGCYKWAADANAERQPWFSCFWMDPDKDNTWVSAPQENVDKKACFNLDSCDGGKGESGGGCYKWALDADAKRQPWE